MEKVTHITKNQHYIPQFYQKSWDSGGDRLYRYSKWKDQITQVAIRHNCSDRYIYEADKERPNNAFEKGYQELEDELAQPYKDFIGGVVEASTEKISVHDKILIYRLYVNFVTRNPQYIYENGLYKRLAMSYSIKDSDKADPIVSERMILNGLAYGENFSVNIDKVHICTYVSNNGDVLFSNPVCIVNGRGYFALSPRVFVIISSSGLQEDDQIIYRNYDPWILYFQYCQDENIQDVYGMTESHLKIFRDMYKRYKNQ